MASHEKVVDVSILQEELPVQDALDREATRLVQAACTHVRCKHSQRDLPRPAAACLRQCGCDKLASDSVALSRRVDRKAVDDQNVSM